MDFGNNYNNKKTIKTGSKIVNKVTVRNSNFFVKNRGKHACQNAAVMGIAFCSLNSDLSCQILLS